MITNYKATTVLGSSDLQTSVANQEIIPEKITVYNFELLNDQDCHAIINNSDPIYYRAGQGINFPVVFSLKFVENNITFNWSGVKG